MGRPSLLSPIVYLIENRWGHLFHDFGPAEAEDRSQTRPVE